MINNLPPGTSVARHFRSPSSSGGKDWVCAYVNGEIHVFYGKTGTINRIESKSGTLQQMAATAQQKINKGYQMIDSYDPAQGWQSQKTQGTVSKPLKPSQPPPLVPVVDMGKTPEESIQWDF